MDTSSAHAGNPGNEQRDIEENKDIAAFSYLWIMSVVVFFLKKQSPFVRYHSKQAMILFGLSIIVWFIPFLNRLLELILLCCMAYGFLNAAQGHKKDVPIVGPLSRGEMTVREAWRELTALAVRMWTVVVDLTKSHKKPADDPAKKPADEASSVIVTDVSHTASDSTPSIPQSEITPDSGTSSSDSSDAGSSDSSSPSSND